MPDIIFESVPYFCKENESVLDCLISHDLPIPSSCRSGVCQSCMMKAVSGKIPEKAQDGLKATLAAQNYFLACSCFPTEDMEVALPDAGMAKTLAKVMQMEYLNADILGITLETEKPFEYTAGQFINFYKDSTLSRSYSLASVPTLDHGLRLHVRKVPNGAMTGWIFESLKTGDTVTISEAAGDCFYVSGKPEQSLLLIGTGSGLAPLCGIVRDALSRGHKGAIKLYHGSYDVGGLYLVDELRKLSEAHDNFDYVPCISEADAPEGCAKGVVLDVALKDNPDLSGYRVFLCGNPDMVNAAKKETFFAGASMAEIHADPFG